MDKHCENTGKRCFGSQTEARNAMRKLSARLRVYRCPYCNLWHMTKRTQPTKLDRQRREDD